MNTHRLKIRTTLPIGMLILAFMLLIVASRQIVTAAPQTIDANAGEDITDYPIGELVTLDGSDSSGPTGVTLYYTWQVVDWPLRDGSDTPDVVDSDHHDGEIGHFICLRSTDPRCVIDAFSFFDADDVGTWMVRLTVDDGVNYDTDDLLITIKGFDFNERRPNAEERDVTQVSNGCIQPGTLDNNLILSSQVPGVIYEDDEHNGEDYSMQAPLIALLEHLLPLAEEDGLLTRVTDAWDSDCSGHGTNSTHYEGRGIDIKGRYAGVGNDENPQEVRRIALRVQQAAEEAGFNLNLNNPTDSNIWIWAEPKYDSNTRERLTGQDHVHVSIEGEHRGPYNHGFICDSADCLTHVESLGIGYSAAAAAEMVLNWQGWSGIQQELYWWGTSYGGTNCEAMAGLLNMHINRGWTCVRVSSLDEALRTAAFWMDITQEGNKEGMPFPVLIPMDAISPNFYDHWVAVQGYIATADPSSQGSTDNPGAGTYQVGGLYVIDPYVDGSNSFARRFVSRHELEGNYEALHSDIVPNLGITYAMSGPPYTVTDKATTFELVVPAGCTRSKSSPMMMLAASASTSGAGLFCDSRFSIVSPPPDSTVTTTIGQNVRVIAMVPNNIAPLLKVTEIINANGDEGTSMTLSGEYVQTTSDFFGSDVWEFAWSPFTSYTHKYRLTVIDPLNADRSCGSVEVIPNSAADSTAPEVYFLQPISPDGQIILIEARHPVPIRVRALDNQGIREIGGEDSVEIRIQSDRLGINLPLTEYEYCGPACYQFTWDINDTGKWPDGAYSITATAFDAAGFSKSVSLNVGLGQGDPVKIDSFSLKQNQVVRNKHEIKITASGGLGRLIADLSITGPEPLDRKNIPLDNGVEERLLEWTPREEGRYTVHVKVYDQLKPSNQATVTRTVDVRRNDIIWDGEWKKLSPATSPGVKNAAMVDTGDGIYLFGGQRISGGAFSNKLWKWDGTNWVDQTPSSPPTWPEARTYPQLTYDSKRGKLVLFAGIGTDGNRILDVWEYTISTGLWALRSKPASTPYNYPPALHLQPLKEGKGATRFAYDALHDRPLYLYTSTFLWDSEIGNWESFGNTYRPELSWVAYDAGRNVVVSYTPNRSPDIAEWDGSKWKEIQIESWGLKPDLKQSNLIGSPYGVYLIGGETSTKELWFWDGRLWTRIHASQGATPNTNYYDASVAYDSARSQLMVYTTNGQTWVYSTKLENLSATPKLYDEVWPPGSGKKLGPGMQLTFRPYPHPNVAAYETQVSEDGGATWQACTNCGYNLDGFIQHHGSFNPAGCGHGYYYCLKREQSYSYRVRPLNQADQPMLDWTYVFNATSFDWPAHVEIEAQTPGPYQNGETVTLNLKNSYGQGMKVDWIISAWGGATATIVEGCGQGYNYKYLISQTCSLTISYQTTFDIQGTPKLAALEPPTSVYVTVTGTDVWNNTSYSDRITLNFESGDEPPRITKVEPWLYPAEYEPGKKYGPGMRLEWIHSPHPERAFYEIQFSEDGGTTWQVYKYARDDQWDWVNHHGNLFCEHGFYRCLKRNQVYHYRIRALDSAESPITDWSDVVSATSMEWPAHVEIAATPPGLQYPSNTVVTLDLVNTYGSGLQIEWELFPHGQANFSILDSTCQNGSFLGHAKVQRCKLRIWVNPDTSGTNNSGDMKLAAPLMAFNSVRVVVTGTDTLGYHFSDQVDLTFKKEDDDTIKETSIDTSRAQWTDM